MTVLTVIIVEDHADSGKVVEEAIQYFQSEADIHMTNDGEQCLQWMRTLNPSVVVTDLALPGMDGWSLLAAIRKDAAIAHVPVIAMTAYHSASVADDALKAGFDGYFSKPIDVFTFGENVMQIVSNA